MTRSTTTVAISGGGPAGIMLGLLLARRGVEVLVLEKHADFLRDFRGDTVHPMTQTILDELGLIEEFDQVVRGRMTSVEFATTDGVLVHQQLASAAPRGARFTDIALVPQWDLLDLLARAGRAHPGFHLVMEAQVTGVLRDDRAVRGLRYRKDGEEHEVRAEIDVLWFPLDQREGDPTGLRGVTGRDGSLVATNRGDLWQVALLVADGVHERLRAAGLDALHARITALAPWAADRLASVGHWDDVKLLRVGVHRLRRWSAAGIMAIGDAAHTMSPIGGVGVEMAAGDAVAADNLLGPALLRAQADPARLAKVLDPALLRRVQRRRQPGTVLVQRIQVIAQEQVLAVTRAHPEAHLMPPRWVLALLRGPVAGLLPRVFVYGIRHERVHAHRPRHPMVRVPALLRRREAPEP